VRIIDICALILLNVGFVRTSIVDELLSVLLCLSIEATLKSEPIIIDSEGLAF